LKEQRMTSARKKQAVMTAAVMAAGISACGGGDHNNTTATSSGPGTSKNLSLDTAQTLTLAQTPSETTTPFMVDNGALVLNDTSDTAEPISINAP
jgi:hypothetical protein